MKNDARESFTFKVDDPNLLNGNDSHFSVTMPKTTSEKEFQYVLTQLEFRRKCMNQGFDNLIELLKAHWAMKIAVESLEEPRHAE